MITLSFLSKAAQNTTRKTMPRTRQTKGSTSSKSSAFCPILRHPATKMQETRNKMPATRVYLLEKTHYSHLFFFDFGYLSL